MTIRLVLAGCGNMGFTVLSGWLKSGPARPARGTWSNRTTTCASVPRLSRLQGREREAARIAAAATPDLVSSRSSPGDQDVAPPQAFRQWRHRRIGGGRNAWRRSRRFSAPKTPVVRCMPNLRHAIGKGMMVLFANPPGFAKDVRRR